MTGVVPLVDDGLGNGSCLLVADGEAVVLDPWRDSRACLAEVQDRGVRLRWVLETHLHADFISGARELVARGAELAPLAEPTWPSTIAVQPTARSLRSTA